MTDSNFKFSLLWDYCLIFKHSLYLVFCHFYFYCVRYRWWSLTEIYLPFYLNLCWFEFLNWVFISFSLLIRLCEQETKSQFYGFYRFYQGDFEKFWRFRCFGRPFKISIFLGRLHQPVSDPGWCICCACNLQNKEGEPLALSGYLRKGF